MPEPSLRLCHQLICSVCGQNFNDSSTLEAAFLVKLFGTAHQYVQCCCCGQLVEDNHRVLYRRKWDRWAHKLVKERIAQLVKEHPELGETK